MHCRGHSATHNRQRISMTAQRGTHTASRDPPPPALPFQTCASTNIPSAEKCVCMCPMHELCATAHCIAAVRCSGTFALPLSSLTSAKGRGTQPNCISRLKAPNRLISYRSVMVAVKQRTSVPVSGNKVQSGWCPFSAEEGVCKRFCARERTLHTTVGGRLV